MTNDSDILIKFQSGDEYVFDEIFKRFYPGLCTFAVQYVTPHEAEEIVQEVMVWLWENRKLIVPDKSLKSLLFTIVKNRCINEISHKSICIQVHGKLQQKFSENFEDPDFYIVNDLMNALNKALENLPKEYQEAFVQNRFDGLSYKEIALRAGVSDKTIAYRISQALKILRKDLKDYLPFLMWILYN